MSHPIWIVKDKLLFQDIINKKICYIDAWGIILDHWLFEPACHLASDRNVTDRGIALLTLELAFFEPFGSILTGKDSEGRSQATFSKGLERFAGWLFEKKLIDEDENFTLTVIGNINNPNIIYMYARCGLMHKMTMQGGFVFIDALNSGKNSITYRNYSITVQKKDGSTEVVDKILLVDPWRLLPQLKNFVEDFKQKLIESKNDESDVYKNFKTTFERTIVNPGRVYLNMQAQ